MAIEELVTKGPAFKPAHPGEMLREDVLPALDLSKAAFARHIGVSRNTLYKLLNKEQPVTLDIALRLGKALGNGGRFWLALQAQHDIWTAEREARVDVMPLNDVLRDRIARVARKNEKTTAKAGPKNPAKLSPQEVKKVAASDLTQRSGLAPATRRDKKRSK